MILRPGSSLRRQTLTQAKKITVAASQTSDAGSRISILGLSQLCAFEQATRSPSSSFFTCKNGNYISRDALNYSTIANNFKIPGAYNNEDLLLIHLACPLWFGSTEALLHVIFTLGPRLMEPCCSLRQREGGSGEVGTSHEKLWLGLNFSFFFFLIGFMPSVEPKAGPNS